MTEINMDGMNDMSTDDLMNMVNELKKSIAGLESRLERAQEIVLDRVARMNSGDSNPFEHWEQWYQSWMKRHEKQTSVWRIEDCTFRDDVLAFGDFLDSLPRR